MQQAAILDFKLRAAVMHSEKEMWLQEAFRVDTADVELGNSDFLVQMEHSAHTITYK